jgi:hypothetical protein
MGPINNSFLLGLFVFITVFSIFLAIFFCCFNFPFCDKEKKGKNDSEEEKNEEELKLIDGRDEKEKKEEKEEDLNLLLDKIESKNYDDECGIYCNKDIIFGITILGRIIITLYSFYGLLFLYNIIIQFLTFIPLLFYNIDNFLYKLFTGIIYIVFSSCFSNIMVIPTFEFLSFPFLFFNNPLSHLYSFKYIVNNNKFDMKRITDSNNFYISLFLIGFEILYFIAFLLGISSNTISFIDYINFFLLLLIYIYYLTIFFCYCLISLIFFFWLL